MLSNSELFSEKPIECHLIEWSIYTNLEDSYSLPLTLHDLDPHPVCLQRSY